MALDWTCFNASEPAPPNEKSLFQIADFFEVPVGWLMGHTGKREVNR